MNRIRSFITSRSGFALVSNLVSLVTALLLFRPFWEESDDIGIAMLAEGVYGHTEPHLNYSGIIYGKILCFLSRMIPELRWHAVIMYAVTFCVTTAFTYILAKNAAGKILSVIYLAASSYEVYVALQFSKIALVLGMMSFMILFGIIKEEHPVRARRTLVFIAVAGSFFSHIIRLESFLLATMLAGIYGIWLVISDITEKRIAKTIKSYCMYFIPVFALFGICCFADHAAYASKEWNEYISFYYSAANMVDYHNDALLYELHGSRLEELGVSENDATMFITYEYSDTDFMTTDLMDEISLIEPKGIGYVNTDFLKAWVDNIYKELFRLSSIVTGLVMILAILSAAVWKEDNRLYHIANISSQFIISFIVLFYFQYSGRWCHRIVCALLLGQLILFIRLLDDMNDIRIDVYTRACVLFVLGLSLIGHRLGNEFEYRKDVRKLPDYEKLVTYMENNKDHLFVGDVFTMIDYGKYDVFTPGRKGQFDNYLSADLVLSAHMPICFDIAERFGYRDPFKALAARDDRVILIDNISPEVERRFCDEHGDGGKYELVELEDVGGLRLYNIR
ncbi:MAG: hypothetical protein J5367_04345 [Lachnospiraceae bacterium]|nr:hypothetical protein [Lachnospiraceae bacterium]